MLDAFPSDTFRGNQEQTLGDIQEAFRAGNDVVLVQAPTGSGKSLLARAVAGCANTPRDSKTGPYGAYYTTPQVSQLEEVRNDPLLDDIAVLSGSSNYSCILNEPDEQGTPVPKAKCNREDDFECDLLHRCPYYNQRQETLDSLISGMTLAYFLETAYGDAFPKRDVVVIDEAHGVPDWAEIYATVELGVRTVPNWSKTAPSSEIETLDDAVDYVTELTTTLDGWYEKLKRRSALSEDEALAYNQLQKLVPDLNWFLDTAIDDSPITWVPSHNTRDNILKLKPLRPQRFLETALWDRGDSFLLLSATLLNKNAFCARVGLDADDVAMVEVPHTFPLENRPLVDITQGEMTYEEREQTIPKIADAISTLLSKHESEKGLIHCHSYDIQSALVSRVQQDGWGSRIRDHKSHNRDHQLERWIASDRPEVFFSVKMEEALDLKYDLCRWQVLCKAPYENTSDPVVSHQLENEDRWGWYYRTALRTIIQACGRIVRADDDYGVTYIADESILDVFDRAQHDMPDWFQDQVGAMTQLTLQNHQMQGAKRGL
jgi:Rad3-related DNA helicase